jgi:FkbM family methyltransferase
MYPVHRLVAHYRRWRRARRLGINLTRSASWQLPPRALIRGREWLLRAPADKGTEVAFFDIFLNDCYGIEALGPRADTVLDIGAHVGFFSVHARNTFPEATIHAYEPNPALAECLAQQAAVGRFTVFPEAVGRADGWVALDVPEDSVQARSRRCADGRIPQVAFRTCVERLGGRVDVLKLDCEGAEWDILEDPEAWQAVRYVGMEFHLFDGHTRAELATRLARAGLRVLSLTSGSASYGLCRAVRA